MIVCSAAFQWPGGHFVEPMPLPDKGVRDRLQQSGGCMFRA